MDTKNLTGQLFFKTISIEGQPVFFTVNYGPDATIPQVLEFAKKAGWISHGPVTPVASEPPSKLKTPRSVDCECRGAYLKRNKFKGEAKFYCAKKLGEGLFCGRKFDADGNEVKRGVQS